MALLGILEPEDTSDLSTSEVKCRRIINIGFRFMLAVFTVSHLFDFLFSSIWMHGYIWSLNLPIDLDMTDKPAGLIVRHQLDEMGNMERVLQSGAVVLAVLMCLLSSGYAQKPGKNTWHLMKMSAIVGLVCGFLRPIQLKQRFFLSLHEGFYVFFMFFIVSFILTIRFGEKLEKKKVE